MIKLLSIPLTFNTFSQNHNAISSNFRTNIYTTAIFIYYFFLVARYYSIYIKSCYNGCQFNLLVGCGRAVTYLICTKERAMYTVQYGHLMFVLETYRLFMATLTLHSENLVCCYYVGNGLELDMESIVCCFCARAQCE